MKQDACVCDRRLAGNCEPYLQHSSAVSGLLTVSGDTQLLHGQRSKPGLPLAKPQTILSCVTLTIPLEKLGDLRVTEKDALVDIAIGLYKREEVSLGRAAEVAGLSSVQLLGELGRRHIPINYGPDDLQADLATLNDKP
jgi:predicted HTH domain antitoxin